jgi:N-acyl-D-aspartate/D-glutamate deacylase
VRDVGAFSIEQGIAKLTGEPAAWMGYADRGRLEVGLRADVNVIDLERLSLERPRLANDLPAGGRRFLQRANGYRATLVRGEIVSKDGNLTENRPGRVVRPG